VELCHRVKCMGPKVPYISTNLIVHSDTSKWSLQSRSLVNGK